MLIPTHRKVVSRKKSKVKWTVLDPLEEEMATPPVFLPEKSHGQRSLMGYSLWGCMHATDPFQK